MSRPRPEQDPARERLKLARQELARNLDALAEAARPVELDQTRVGRLSRMDALQGQAMVRAQRDRLALGLRRIDAALARVDAGVYGTCVGCEEEIDPRRLSADPAAPLCVTCASQSE